MSGIQIIDKKVRLDILSRGGKKIGQVVFNPDDTRIYSTFVGLIHMLAGKDRDMQSIELTESEKRAMESDKPEADLDDALSAFKKVKSAADIAVETLTEVCKGLNGIFGDGVCEAFMQGDMDADLLAPLIDAVTPYFRDSRDGKVNKYRAKK